MIREFSPALSVLDGLGHHAVDARSSRTDVTLYRIPSRLRPFARFRIYKQSGKVKRLRNFSTVRVAPCSFLGKPKAESAVGMARLLDDRKSAEVRRLIRRRHPVLHGVLVPLAHRLMRYDTQHCELTLADAEAPRPRARSGPASQVPTASSSRTKPSTGSRPQRTTSPTSEPRPPYERVRPQPAP
jgi:PPOX class probable F420-dependent enzyme